MGDVCDSLSHTGHHRSLRFDSCSMAAHDGPPTKRRKIRLCTHSVIYAGMCLRCRARVSEEFGLPFEYMCPSLRLSKACANKLREMRTEAMLGLKKLHLVLDLDHTLVHSVEASELTPEDKHLEAEAECNSRSCQDVSTARGEGNCDLFLLEDEAVRIITKLRPFAREFLRKVSGMFELSIYTMGNRWYASEIAKLLDPDGCYFADRIISREDCTVKGRKSLDVVLARESNVLIVDDTEEVWPDHAANLLVIDPYFFFSQTSQKQKLRQLAGEIGSSPNDEEEKRDRDEALAVMLGDLSEIHSCYFGKTSLREVLGWKTRT